MEKLIGPVSQICSKCSSSSLRHFARQGTNPMKRISTASILKLPLERGANGRARFFGENLKATCGIAKKDAHVAHENFSSSESE
jgi:hypothetical protein